MVASLNDISMSTPDYSRGAPPIRSRYRDLIGVLGACLMAATPLWATPPRLDHLVNLTVDDGLGHNTIWDIGQDRTGFLWFATAGSLNRYDGYDFETYKHDPDDPDSLSISEVMSICTSQDGTLWFGTRGGGLNRYEPTQERFTHYRYDPEDPRSLADDTVYVCAEDADGTLWVATDNTLHRFDAETQDFTRFIHNSEQADSLGAGGVSALVFDPEGMLWVGTSEGGLNRFQPETETFGSFRHDPEDPHSLSSNSIDSLFVDRDGMLWVGNGGAIDRLDRDTGQIDRFPMDPSDPATVTNPVTEIHEDLDGYLWVGSHGAGLSVFDRTTGVFRRYRHDPRNPHGLSSDEITELFADRSGILWIATRNGINKFDPQREQFTTFQQRLGDNTSLSGERVWAVTEDSRGTLWVGTYDGGVTAFDRTLGTTQRYSDDANSRVRLPSKAVTALLEDRSGELWVGTSDGLARFDRQRESAVHYLHDSEDPNSLPENFVRAVLERSNGELWIATSSMVARFDRAVGSFKAYRHDPTDPDGLSTNYVYDLYEDRAGTLWVVTFGGLNRYDPMLDGFSHVRHDPNDINSLSHDQTAVLHQATDGIYWIGTNGGGLNRWDAEGKTFRHYREKDGLPNDSVLGILEDEQGKLWLSTDKGLASFDPRTQTFRVFGIDDGLHGEVFYIGPTYRSPSGEMFFGGSGGLSAFFPKQIEDHLDPPVVAITNFSLLNEPVPLRRKDPASPLAEAISATQEITLTHRHKILAFEFAALHYASPRKNRYAYQLEGFDTDWITTGARKRFAQYTNLDAGDYVFRVKASNKDGVWNEDGVSIRLAVLPPPWKTWWAYTLYTLALASMVMGYLRWQRTNLERERSLNTRLREVDRLKDEFLANTSHELRTPLYGIVGIAESLMDGAAGSLPEPLRANLAMIVGSGRRLSGLVNDILDFSRMSRKGLELQKSPVDLRTLTDIVLALSQPLVGGKELTLVNGISPNLPLAEGDENRLHQVLFNLVSNAIKFTETGRVEVSAVAEEGRLIVQVRDTGIGISEAHQERIFESFEQADASTEREYGGTGLGLAVTKELVSLHGGSLWVESEPGVGSTFFFTLPVSDEPQAESVTIESTPPSESISRPQVPFAPILEVVPDPGKLEAPLTEGIRRILIVDDEPVIRQVLVNYLAVNEFRTRQAPSGEQALKLMAQESFDLVLLDVMMPKMSGYDVCRQIRKTYAPEELPVIFLTAKDRVEDLVTGFSVGANDFLTKPVTKSELLTRVKTHLDLVFAHRSRESLLEERTAQLSEREQLLHQLEVRNTELTRFNYTVSHDLKNPLVTIRNFAGLLRRDAAGGRMERIEHDLNRIESAADKMYRLIDELLELARSGHLSGPLEKIPYTELIAAALEELDERIRERHVEIVVDSELPTVLGDRTRLLEVVENLIDNAIKYMGDQPQPKITLGVRRDGDQQVFYVSDNGLGINPQYHQKIFGLFERLNPDGEEGTGLGLALVQQIIEAHGGKVWVESAGRGQGSTFYFTVQAEASTKPT